MQPDKKLLKFIEHQWEYRYLRLVHPKGEKQAEQWLKLFYFLGDFKQHCASIVKSIVLKTGSVEQISQINPRYFLKQPGQKIYIKDNIIIRMVPLRLSSSGSTAEADAYRNLQHEFTANNVFNNLLVALERQNVMKVHVPLCCLVDYMGYRAFCQADTTINGLNSVLYGPISDKTLKQDPKIEPILKTIGANLNLKPFEVASEEKVRVTIPFCLNVQVHTAFMEKYDSIRRLIREDSSFYEEPDKRISRDQFYLYNLHKIWPIYVENNLEASYGFLRPEYVLQWKHRLSSYAFMNPSQDRDHKSELELADACKTLKEDRTTQLVERLDRSDIVLVDSYGVIVTLHEYGINLRFMGLLYEKTKMGHVKSMLKMEMLASTLKQIFYSNLEGETRHIDFKDNLADFLNLIYVVSVEGREFFKEIVYPQLEASFQVRFSQYPPNVPGGGLLHAISFHFGVKLKIMDYPFFYDGEEPITLFTPSLIGDAVAHCQTFDMETLEIKAVCSNYKEKKRYRMFVECEKELELLISINRGLNHVNTFSCSSYPEAAYYAESAEVFFRLGRYEDAVQYAHKALKCTPDRHADTVKPICVLIKSESIKGQIGTSFEYYDKALAAIIYHLGPNHPLEMSVYNVIALEFLRHNEPQKCQKILKKSLDVCSQTLGYMHRAFSQILIQLSMLPLEPSVCLVFLHQCMTILETLKVDEKDQRELKEVCNNIAEYQLKMGDSKSLAYFAHKAQNWKMEVIAAERLRKYDQVLDLCSKKIISAEDIFFALEKCLHAETEIIESQQRNKLYKIYVALEEKLVDKKQAQAAVIKFIKEHHTPPAQLIEETIVTILQNVDQMYQHKEFYLDIWKVVDRMRDSRLTRAVQNFLNIVSMLGDHKTRKYIDSNAIFYN